MCSTINARSATNGENNHAKQTGAHTLPLPANSGNFGAISPSEKWGKSGMAEEQVSRLKKGAALKLITNGMFLQLKQPVGY